MTQKLEKAIITVLEGRLASQAPIEVLFNPTEYSLAISNNFQEKSLPGLSSPILQFVNGQANMLTMDLFFDSWTNTGGNDVTELTKKVAQTLEIDADLHAPPPVEFSWGNLTFKAVVQSLSQRFTMFNSSGQPVRATLNISFKQYQTLSEQLQSPRRNSSDKTKRRIFSASDSLWAIAEQEYGDPKYWRLIARKSRVPNPRAIVPGDVVTLPPLENSNEPAST
ncbi:MAG: hypothetical protein V3T17_02280 [Pseudomonadales bacterium]